MSNQIPRYFYTSSLEPSQGVKLLEIGYPNSSMVDWKWEILRTNGWWTGVPLFQDFSINFKKLFVHVKIVSVLVAGLNCVVVSQWSSCVFSTFSVSFLGYKKSPSCGGFLSHRGTTTSHHPFIDGIFHVQWTIQRAIGVPTWRAGNPQWCHKNYTLIISPGCSCG